MAPRPESFGGPAVRLALRLLLVLVAVFAARAFLLGGPEAGRDTPSAVGLEDVSPEADRGDRAVRDGGEGSQARLQANRVCPASGYLCTERGSDTPLRVTRWPDDTGVLRVRVPLPSGEPPARARELQEAAARGLRAWDGHPFRIRVELSDRVPDSHIVTRWLPSLEDGRLGTTRTRWARSPAPTTDGAERGHGAEFVVEVLDFALVTRVPGDPARPLPLRQVELAAAHEMGHVLGLPHSDAERDLMFPRNTASRPTARDYRTLEALYALENGAEIR